MDTHVYIRYICVYMTYMCTSGTYVCIWFIYWIDIHVYIMYICVYMIYLVHIHIYAYIYARCRVAESEPMRLFHNSPGVAQAPTTYFFAHIVQAINTMHIYDIKSPSNTMYICDRKSLWCAVVEVSLVWGSSSRATAHELPHFVQPTCSTTPTQTWIGHTRRLPD